MVGCFLDSHNVTLKGNVAYWGSLDVQIMLYVSNTTMYRSITDYRHELLYLSVQADERGIQR